MQHLTSDRRQAKGWLAGPWDADLPIALGYATAAADVPHLHQTMTEIYLIAQGSAEVRVEQRTVPLAAGDVLIVAPGEAHAFVRTSPDYFHFVIQAPGLAGAAALADKVLVDAAMFGAPTG